MKEPNQDTVKAEVVGLSQVETRIEQVASNIVSMLEQARGTHAHIRHEETESLKDNEVPGCEDGERMENLISKLNLMDERVDEAKKLLSSIDEYL